MDICLSGAALVMASPVLAAIALAIRVTSPGPVIYRGMRLGVGGRPFPMLKFRTMHAGAPDMRNADGSTYSAEDDPRVTRVGRLLRRTSLDELPQLWNVLKGDMSLVGPRPELPDQIRFYNDADRRRLDVPPGITGLAQVSGRNALSWEDRRALDIRYIDSMNLRTDLLLLLRTIPGVLSAHGVFSARGTAPRESSRER
jgi:lipopolysaccharide/colanic/teichoic acid biosynthesis glycosyltransferase